MTETNGNGHNGNGNNGLSNGYAEVPYRGTIIVDANVLFGLCPHVPNNNGNGGKKINHYIDLLPFLAKNGYNIVIPEMVSFETGQLLKTGVNINDLYDKELLWKESKDVLTPLLKDAILPVGDKNKENPNINVVSGAGPYYVDEFLGKINELYRGMVVQIKGLSSVPGANSKNNGIKISVYASTRNKITELVREMKEKGKKEKIDYGDEAIISLIGKDYKISDKPVFVLTDDFGLRSQIYSKYPSIKTITTDGFIASIVGAGLSVEAGLPESISIRKLELERRKEIATYDKDKKPLPETLHGDESEYINAINSSPFAKSLRQLADDLKKQKPSDGVAIENGNGNGHDENSPLAKYYKKYGSKANQSDRVPSR